MTRVFRSILAAVFATAVALPLARAQSPSFDVASIKPNRTTGGGFTTFTVRPGGRFVATNASLTELIAYGYQLLGFQLEGAPSWAAADRYDIMAKAEGELAPPPASPSGADAPRVLLMVRSLLKERFQLRMRTEIREMSRFALIVARPGRLGPRLTASTVDCVAIRQQRSRTRQTTGAAALPPPPPAPGSVLPCSAGSAAGYHAGNGMALSSLAGSLSRVVGRTVVDETGLTGPFDWSLEYAPDTMTSARADAAPGASSDKPSLFAALEEQLGLKFETRRGPVQMMVIERVERPSPD